MNKKFFVSIIFTPESIKFFQLNSNKTKVVHYGEVLVPEGLIVNYQVTDTKKLAEIIKSGFSKYGFSERNVGIVVPEFSTFTKVLVLPKMERHELDEAVRWQLHDFLPSSYQNLVTDWKIISEKKDSLEVLAVSIQEDILSGYVESTSSAGLFPSIVETPSLSLARIANIINKGKKIVVYAQGSEALLGVFDGEKILSSLVHNSSDQDGIYVASLQMRKKFQNDSLERIIIGGNQISQKLFDDLSKNEQKIEVTWLDAKVEGINKSDFQKYAIGYSLQFSKSSEPSDENTINLLPKNWVKKYEADSLKLRVWNLLVISTIVLWTSLLTLLGVNLMINSQMSSLGKTNNLNESIPDETSKKVKEINYLSEKVIKINSIYISPVEIINKLAASKVSGISIQKYVVNLENNTILISGLASDRNSLLLFKQSLEKNTEFSGINIPISALAKESNLTFDLEFKLNVKK